MWVWSLGREDPLEEEMASHSSILAWEIPWTEEPGGLQSMGAATSQTQLRITHQTWKYCMTLTSVMKRVFTQRTEPQQAMCVTAVSSCLHRPQNVINEIVTEEHSTYELKFHLDILSL